MKKKIFTIDNSAAARGRSTGHWLRVYRRGLITFSAELVRALKLEKGFFLIQDEENPANWYIESDPSEKAFKVRSTRTKTYMINSVELTNAILSSIGVEEKLNIRMLVSRKPENNLYAILTKSAMAQIN